MSDESNELAVTVHHNNEVTVKDERGYPNVCRDCRHSGWLTEYERQHSGEPITCLLYSGGADPMEGDRVIFDHIRKTGYASGRSRHNEAVKHWRGSFPACWSKNQDGKCADFVRAKPLPWIGNFWRKLFGREWRTRRMRL